jgi:hypothetical protein
MTPAQIETMLQCPDEVVEYVRVAFKALNLFDEGQVLKITQGGYETTMVKNGIVQVHMLVRRLVVDAPNVLAGIVSHGFGSLDDGGIYLKPGDFVGVSVLAAPSVRTLCVKLMGIEISREAWDFARERSRETRRR